jgi:hypothetical protein
LIEQCIPSLRLALAAAGNELDFRFPVHQAVTIAWDILVGQS